MKHSTEKCVFFFSGHFPVSVTILGWSNAYGVSGNTIWHGSGQDFFPALDMFALQLTLASPRWFVEGRKAWKNGEIQGRKGNAKGNPRIMYQDVAVNLLGCRKGSMGEQQQPMAVRGYWFTSRFTLERYHAGRQADRQTD